MDSYSFNSTGDGKLAQPNVNELMIDSLPNWEAIDFEVMCSRCGYNLRLLPEPRCPECGLKFDWRVVLDESAWRSDFLFEHHWRARAIRSWLKTLGRSFRPFKFWKNISIHDRVHPGPLWFLLLTSVYWFVVALHGLAGLGWFVLEVVDQVLTITSVWTGSTYLDDLTHHFKDMATISFTSFPDYFTLPVICYFGPIMVSLGFLCSLRQTLGRCRIRTVQILRVVAYTSTPFSIFGAALLLALTTSEVFIHDRISLMAEIILGICYLGSLPFCLAIYLSAGLKCYLQLPRAWFVGIIIAFVGYLFSPTIFAFVHAFIMNY